MDHTEAFSGGDVVFVLMNIGILTAYVYVAVRIVKIFPVRPITKWAGRAFFVLCGVGTHGEMILHSFNQDETFGNMLDSWHMIVIHVLQLLSVWVFAVYWHQDMVRLAEERQTVEAA